MNTNTLEPEPLMHFRICEKFALLRIRMAVAAR